MMPKQQEIEVPLLAALEKLAGKRSRKMSMRSLRKHSHN